MKSCIWYPFKGQLRCMKCRQEKSYFDAVNMTGYTATDVAECVYT